jgi:hypothetical protein
MTEKELGRINGVISVDVQPHENGQYVCQLSPTFSVEKDTPLKNQEDKINFYGQTKEHAIAIALERLAANYRRIIEEKESEDWLAVERSASGEIIYKHYHVTLHYECLIEAESKFEAMHNTIMGNTVVENAKITVIKISPDLQIDEVDNVFTVD